MFVSNAGQRYVLLQVRAEGLKPTERRRRWSSVKSPVPKCGVAVMAYVEIIE